MNKLSQQAEALLNKKHKLFIDNQWIDSQNEESFSSINPANGDTLCHITSAGRNDVDLAVSAATIAFKKTIQNISPSDRACLLNKLADLIYQHRNPISELECLDNGKPLNRALIDVNSAISHLRYYAGWADKIEGSSIPVNSTDALVYTRREPLGVTGLIVPWNFPLLIAVWKLAPALACGNCCILKPAEQTSITSLYLAGLVDEAGFPPGMIQVLTGNGYTGELLTHHPDIAKISFTGSTEVGRKVLEASSKSNLKKVSLELGGKSPNIIFDDADMERLHESLIWASFYNSGQECTLGSRVYVQKNRFDEVTDRLASRAARLTIGNGWNNPDLGPLISTEQVHRVLKYIETGKKEADLILGGDRIGDELSKGCFVEPTVFRTNNHTAVILQEEIFGPVINVSSFEDEDELIENANNSRYGLASAIWTKNISRAHRLAQKIQAGVVWINGYDMFHPAVPFGGYKESGIGREMGKSAIDLYTQEKVVWANL